MKIADTLLHQISSIYQINSMILPQEIIAIEIVSILPVISKLSFSMVCKEHYRLYRFDVNADFEKYLTLNTFLDINDLEIIDWETNCISGSFVLSYLTGIRYQNSDIDFYVNGDSYLYDIFDEMDAQKGAVHNNKYIDAVVTQYYLPSLKVDVISVKGDIVKFIRKSFDFNFCGSIYAGRFLRINATSILKKKCIVSMNCVRRSIKRYWEFYAGHTSTEVLISYIHDVLFPRIKKYEERGFEIRFPPQALNCIADGGPEKYLYNFIKGMI